MFRSRPNASTHRLGDAENSGTAPAHSLLTRKGSGARSADLKPEQAAGKPRAERDSRATSTKSGRNYSVRGGGRHKVVPLQHALRTAAAGSRSRPRSYRTHSCCIEASARVCSTNGIYVNTSAGTILEGRRERSGEEMIEEGERAPPEG